MRPAAVLALAALAPAVGACAHQADTAAEEQVIRELGRKWVQAVAAKDTMAIGNFYAEDGEFLPQGGPRVTGRDAVRSAWAQFLKAPNLSLAFEPARIVVSSAGDVAYETGTYKLSMDGPKGQRVEDIGKFVVAWKKVGNDWKAVLDIFNSDKSSL